MIHFLTGFGLCLHTLFWGAGLAALLMPRRWARFWPVWIPVCGWALQSAVVWYGANWLAGGTNRYALLSELLPAALLGLAVWRRGLRGYFRDLSAFRWLWVLCLFVMSLLVLPFALGKRGLTSISFGSCDAADYAAGARVFQEFGPDDRGGFLGHTEVVKVMSSDNFQDFWLRLNHFTPSALIAHNGSILHSRPHQLTSLFTASLLALSLPLVFWLCRSLLRYGRPMSFGITALFGLSPLTWYPVFHVAPAQMLAAQAIAALTWLAIMLWRRGGLGGRIDWRLPVLTAVVFWLILGSYNFILLVCLCPAAAYVLFAGAPWRNLRRLALWAAWLLAPLALASVLFLGRVTGLVERFLLFRQYDFGWKIPFLSPEGWLGVVRGTGLVPFDTWVRLLLCLGLGTVFVLFLAQELRRRSFRLPLVAALCLPGIAGYVYLNLRGLTLHTNASYDAYKLLSVFYPGILASLAGFLVFLGGRGPRRVLATGVLAPLATLNILCIENFITRASRPPLVVGWQLNDLRPVDNMLRIGSVNMVVPDFWERLWANYYLLNKPQYFLTHTYEGRLPGELKGDWDLNAQLVRVALPGGQDSFPVNYNFQLINTRHPFFVRAMMGQGWHDIERLGETRWNWGRKTCEITFLNPHPYPVRLDGQLDARGFRAGLFRLSLNGVVFSTLNMTEKRAQYDLEDFVVQPGQSVLRFELADSAAEASREDSRPLALCLFGLTLKASDPSKALAPQPARK